MLQVCDEKLERITPSKTSYLSLFGSSVLTPLII